MKREGHHKRRNATVAAVLVVAVLVAGFVILRSRGELRDSSSLLADRALAPTANPAATRGKVGPNLVVDPADEEHIVELHQELVTGECELNTSFDRGRTWKAATLQAPIGYPRGRPGPCSATTPVIANIGQQSLAFGSGPNLYLAWASTPQPAAVGSTVLISRSVDGGLSFSPGVAVPGLVGGPAPEADHARPELIVDRRSPTEDRLYLAVLDARSNRALVTRSDDAGRTWSTPGEASANNPARNPPPQFPPGSATPTEGGDAYPVPTELTQPVLGPAPRGGGERPLHVGWSGASRGGPCPPACETAAESERDGYLVVATSTDLGQTWRRRRVVNLRSVLAPSAIGLRGASFPRLAARSDGALFLVFNQGPSTPGSANCGPGPYPAGTPGAGTTPCPAFGEADRFQRADHSISADADVWFLRSPDGGATWEGLRQLNDGKRPGLAVPEITQTRHPQVAVAPDGRVDVVWEDRRHWYLSTSVRAAFAPGQVAARCVQTHMACDEARLGDTYYAGSTDGGRSFSANRRVNDRSHNNDVGFDGRLSTYRDYGPSVAALGASRLLVADMDSRQGNALTDTTDVVLREVDLAPNGRVPVQHVVSGGAPDLTVAFSRQAAPGGGEAVLAGDGVTRPATSVVIVNEADPAAALVGGVLARAGLGAVLASPAAGLPAGVGAEVARLAPVGAFVLGDHTALSGQVEVDLVAAGISAARVTRVEGAEPSDLAATVAHALDARTAGDKATSPPLPAFDAAVIVNPADPAATWASGLAANRRLPVLFVSAAAVPAATSEALTALGIVTTLVIGGPDAVSRAVEAALPGPVRLGGERPAATVEAVVVASLARGLPRNIVYVVDADQPLHAALLGAAVGRLGGLVVPVPGGRPEGALALLGRLGLRPEVDRLVMSELTGVALAQRRAPG